MTFEYEQSSVSRSEVASLAKRCRSLAGVSKGREKRLLLKASKSLDRLEKHMSKDALPTSFKVRI